MDTDTGRFDSLLVTSETNNSGQVQIPGIGYSTSFTVSSGSSTVLSIPLAAEIGVSDSVTQLGIHLISQNPVAVYGISYEPHSTDGYLGLPVNALGNHYISLAYTNSQTITGVSTGFAVAGIQNGTSVTITPALTVSTRTAGAPYIVALNSGDLYQLQDGDQGGDLTGTLIDSNQPVAVWGSNSCADIPATVYTCNFIVEQLWPLQWWGTNFITMPITGRAGDTFRVLASQDGTNVSVSGAQAVNLNRGKFLEQILSAPSSISSNYPIYVMQYSNGHLWDNAAVGDPSMITIPPVNEYASDYLAAMPATGFTYNYENITVSASGAGGIVLDGASIPAAAFSPIGSSGYSGAVVTVTAGNHHLNGSVPFGLVEYGSDTRDAYGYPAGVLFITDTPTSTPTATPTPTVTPTPTPTSTPTITPTPTPPIRHWPDPFNPNFAVGGVLKFSYLPQGSMVWIYTVSGEWVQTVAEIQGTATWDGRNRFGTQAAMGIYFFTVQKGNQVLQRGKFLLVNNP